MSRFALLRIASVSLVLALIAACGKKENPLPPNVAPVAQNDAVTTGEDVLAYIRPLENDTDDNGQDDIQPGTLAFTPVTKGTLVASGTPGELKYTPPANFNGTATFTYTVKDAAGAVSNAATVTITVTPINDAPTVSNASFTGNEDTAFGGSVAATDVDSSSFTYQVTQAPAHGAVTISAAGVATYTPSANYNGADSFQFTANDGAAPSNTGTVTLTVQPVNDAPVASAVSDITGNEDTTFGGKAAGSDVDGDPVTFVAGPAAHGTVVMEADGDFSYTPALNFAGDDTFTFRATDGALESAPQTVTLHVTDVAEPTLAVANVSQSESGNLAFAVTLSRAPDGPVTISYATTDGTAKSGAGKDYSSASGALQFDKGQAASQTVTVPVNNDDYQENNETLSLSVSVTGGADGVATTGTVTALGTILDNDDHGLLRVGAGKRSIQPTQAQIAGISESRLGPTTKVQKFNLGGFGLNPLSNIPDDPAGLAKTGGESLTRPVERRVYTNADGKDENTMARAFVVEQVGGQRIAFVMFDAVGAGNVIQKNMTAAIVDGTKVCGPNRDQACFAPEDVIIGMTHTHAGADLQGLWGGVPQQWITDVLYPGAVQAVRDALATQQPARLRMSVGLNNDYNSYRRPKIDPKADADGHMTLLRATTDDGQPIGSILQYAAHPTGIGAGHTPRTPHPDYILGAMDWLERPEHFGGVSLYYNGPIADASGSGSRPGCVNREADRVVGGVTYNNRDFGNTRCKGEGIADAALAFYNASSRELAPTLKAAHTEVTLPVTNPGFLAFGLTGSFNRYYDFAELPTSSIPGIGPQAQNLPQLTPTARTEVSRVTIGGAASGLEIVTIPGEGTNTFGEYIRKLAKTDTMLMGLTHNSFGYIIPEEEFSQVDQEGEDGLVAPFTGYEESVSMGPLTAPILRSQGYNVLFEAGPEKEIPPAAANCLNDNASPSCATVVAENRLAHLIDQLSICTSRGLSADGCFLRTTIGFFDPILDPLSDGLATIGEACQALPAPLNAACVVFGDPRELDIAALPVTGVDSTLAPLVAKMAAQGCDVLDPNYCLFPFPSDHFTVAAAEGSIQAKTNDGTGGTGRRVNFNILGMPRNSAGKPVDPTEWNRNDGFSPGQMIVTYAPGIAANADGTIKGAAPITDIERSLDADAPIFVIDADTGERHLVWAEIDLNANLMLHGRVPQGDDVTGEEGLGEQRRPLEDGRAALIVRPAKNFAEGHRYIVVLRNLKDGLGKSLVPSLGFRACTDQVPSALRQQSPLKERCDHVSEVVATAVRHTPGLRKQDLYLAWDFTVASAQNNVGRLAHMADVAFNSLATVTGADCTRLTESNAAVCAAPKFTIDTVTENPRSGIARRVEGTITVPSFVTPVDPAPLDNSEIVRRICGDDGVPQSDFQEGCRDVMVTGDSAALPPNRLYYNPADKPNPSDPAGARYGDGLPDTVGTMQTAFICMIPEKAKAEPARASIYGHGLLDGRGAVTYEGSPEFESEHNFMYCAVDLFGFATGDLGNVASALVDMSNFPVIPDASQQGLLNYMFLARAMQHPNGFAAADAFKNGAAPLYDRREIFYNGNSQGGIVGGAVMAISKDINRGVLGSLGMNYSTLLQRSKDFDPYSTAVYGSYVDPLDRMAVFSLMQMLWDRSENNGYAEHLTTKSPVEGGPVDHVMLNSMFADQQVTAWSADVMARTMDIPTDYVSITRSGHTHPDKIPGWPQPSVTYKNDKGSQYADVSSVLFEYNSKEFSDRVPIGNVPMREGPDPHDISHRRRQGRCQISHWLQREGRLLNINTDAFKPEDGDRAIECPAIRDNSGAPAPGTLAPAGGFDPATAPAPYQSAFERFVAALTAAGDLLSDGDAKGALDAALAGTQQLFGDAAQSAAQQIGQIAGLSTPTPGVAAPELPKAEALMAGAAKGMIRVPVGTPLGGYLRPPVGGEYIGEDPVGEVADNQPGINDGCDPAVPASCIPNVPPPDELRVVHSPYAKASPPTRGYYDSLLAKAVAMYDGHDYVVMVKTDFIGMLDELVQDTKAEVKRRTGTDLGNGLIMSATHTHDGPGAVANNSTRYFWAAMDTYQHDVYVRVVGDLATVVVDALKDLKPARIGHTTGLDQVGMNHYRRGRMAWYKDNDTAGCNWSEGPCNSLGEGDDFGTVPNDANELRRRIGVLRIEDRDTGAPIALVVNYAAHGIAFDVENQFFSGDVLASLEREVEQTYVKPAGAGDAYRGPIAMLIQNTTGDVTPSTDYHSIRSIEGWGKRIAPQIRAIADRVNKFDSKPDLRTVSQRIILNRERLGYGPGEYPYPWGAAQCGNDVAVPFADVGVNDIPGYDQTGGPTKQPYCIFGTPPDENDLADNGVAENGAFLPGDTILSAVKIGDITLIANPGEPLTEYGVRMLEMAKGEGYDPHDTFIWGYTGDHIGYILPPVKEDWEQFGGAESTTTFWGWKQGARFIDVQKTLLAALRDGTSAPADEFKADYSKYRAIYDAKPKVAPTPSLLPGAVVAQPKAIKRFEKTAFVFEGGDPVVDFPQVTMLNANGTPVTRANGEIVNTMFEMHLKYRLVTGRHLWTVEFESPRDWATGSYKFAVKGVASQGANRAYELTSSAFAVNPTGDLELTNFSCGTTSCSARINYKAYPSNYRIVDYRVNPDNKAPVLGGKVQFTTASGVVDATDRGDGLYVANVTGVTSAKGFDAYGNFTPASNVPAPDADGDGVADANDQCPNTPSGQAVDANGCPTETPPAENPLQLGALCEPFAGYCASDIPGSDVVQGVLDTIWGTANGGGGGTPPPPSGVPFANTVAQIASDAQANSESLPDDVQAAGETTAGNAQDGTLVDRSAEVVIMEGRQFPDWSQPPAQGLANPYPSGVGGDGEPVTSGLEQITGEGTLLVRNAHNGTILYPPAGFTGLPTAAKVDEIAAYKYEGGSWIEIPVQVDERFPYFLANANSGFSFYSGTDMELTYAFDTENWKADGVCSIDPASIAAMPDPVPGLDDDDEIVFMARDAGAMAGADVAAPNGTTGIGQEIAIMDPINPGAPKYVYLYRQAGGSSFNKGHYVQYARHPNADQFVDQTFWADADPLKIGTSNTGYGPNMQGTVCGDNKRTPADEGNAPRPSSDRFPRDGMTVTSKNYRISANGRWMIDNVQIAKPDASGAYGADIMDRWKGRAFQQSPDSTISLVGFEDEQVNWEANSALLGERVGPVRAIREIWGADSGTNVTKTETYYTDAYVYRYHVRVHPIPPDGLYTSWDYNRSAMVPTTAEAAAGMKGGRYFTAVRGAGVPIDGKNDDIGQVDNHEPVGGYCMTDEGPQPAENFGGSCPLFFDASDPTLNLPLAMYNWEQVAAKGNLGSLVYLFELKSPTIGANALAIPYYRDDACLDDGTGDDPVQRPWPGESYRWNGGTVPKAYDQMAGRALDHSGKTFNDCLKRQGAHAQHGVHFLAPPESDNATMPVPTDEIDGQQWAFAVPQTEPANVGERYANIIRAPLVKVARPRPAEGVSAGGHSGGASPGERGLMQIIADFSSAVMTALAGEITDAFDALVGGVNTLVAGLEDLLIGNDHGSVRAIVTDVANNPSGAPDSVPENAGAIVDGYEPVATGRVHAGVGVVDMTPDVGYGAGQYAGEGPVSYGIDPFVEAKKQEMSYGVMTRLTGRAIVIEGANGKRVALVKSDNYLAQDNLGRRIAQILEQNGSTIGYDQILYGVTHAHSSSYYSGSPAVAAFQDAFDPRFFEFQARKLAQAILTAEASMKPARMGATTVRHKIFKGNIMGPAVGDDGTPVQYPSEYGDHGLVVMRIETDEAQPKPIAVWVNWGEHPEGLDGYDLHSADFVAFLERFVERDLGAPLVYSQGDVGSSEKSGNEQQRLKDDGTPCTTDASCGEGQGVWRDWNHKGYVQNERNVRFLADAVVKGWKVIGGEMPADAPVAGAVKPNNYVTEVQVPLSNSFPVDYRNAFVPGPISHPYPSFGNCRTQPTVDGDPGSPTAPDCERGGTGGDPTGTLQMIWENLKAHGIPVPENYDASAFVALEENARLKLQAVRLGDVVLGSCACEAQVDLILNFESRANDVAGDIYDGFDWACVAEDANQKGLTAAKRDAKYAQACKLQREKYFDVAEYPAYDRNNNVSTVPGDLSNAAKLAHMRAEVHNDAAGWDSPFYAPYANAQPANVAEIKGNFTKEELPANRGYKIAVGVGHAGDYNGYTVSYREYMSHDHYRKALTSYGAHTADYMVTRLVRMAGAMKGAPELAPEPHDTAASADEARMVAESRALGAATKNAYEAYYAALPPDLGPAAAVTQPVQNINYFQAANFTWQGGSTAVDNPRVVVERCTDSTVAACADGPWVKYGDQTGDVQTRVQWPQPDGPDLAMVYAGQFAWKWTANFEAYEAFPARLGSTPAGFYRFSVAGCISDGSAPDVNVSTRVANFIAGMLPGDASGPVNEVLPASTCKGGATPYALSSNLFHVTAGAANVTNVTSDANGALAITLAPRSIPKSYTNAFFPYVNAGNDDGRFCRECSFRPWATSAAAPRSVNVLIDGKTYKAIGSGVNWTIAAGLAAGQSATIVATYADDRVSAPYLFTRAGAPPVDGDGDGVPDSSDQCPTLPGTVANNGCPAGGGTGDADNDGVIDSADRCDGTPSTMVVNAQGCSASQRDTDGDGVYDSADNCPVDSNGSQADANHDGIGDACPGGRFMPTTVVAISDSGVNPYHRIYYRPDLTAHPCTYIKGFDCNIPALNLSIGKYATWQEAYDADKAVWDSIQLHKWYWIPKTNIVGAVCFTAAGGGAVGGALNSVDPKTTCVLDDSSDHGTGTSSSVLMEAPEALLLIQEGDSGGYDFATAPVKADVQSHSWGPPAPIPFHTLNAKSMPDPQNCALGQFGPDTLFFLSAGNEALWPTLADSTRFCPAALTIGGATSTAGEVGSWTMYDFASWYCRPGASTKSLDGYGEHCGTSFSAPTAAGAAAAALQQIRRDERYTGRNTYSTMTPRVTRAAFLDALRLSARYKPEATYSNGNGYAPLPLVPGAEYLTWGWGFVDKQIVPDVVKCAETGVCPAKSAEATQWNQTRQQVREDGWSEGSNVPTP